MCDNVVELERLRQVVRYKKAFQSFTVYAHNDNKHTAGHMSVKYIKYSTLRRQKVITCLGLMRQSRAFYISAVPMGAGCCAVLAVLALCLPGSVASVLCGSSACAKGKYCPTRSGGCKSCPVGKFSSERDSPSCAVCAPGQYGVKTGSRVCPSCPMGKYQAHVSRRVCHACEEGRYAPAPFASACRACPLGTYSLSGWYFCDHTCPAGRYQLKRTCPACAAGRFSAKSGQRSCSPCPAGRFSPKATGSNGNKQCKLCPKGQTSQDESFASKGKAGGTRCEPLGKPCPRGRFGKVNGWTTAFHLLKGCPRCPVDTYNDELGQSACKVCRCKPGQARGSSLGRTWCECETCAPGKYAPIGFRGKGCIACAPGMFQAKVQQASCHPCPKGQMTGLRTHGATSCGIVCPAGKYSAAGGWVPQGQECQICPVGKYQDMHKQRFCHQCPCDLGTYQVGAAECSCLPCAAGRFSNQRHTYHCEACGRGRSQSASGAHRCNRCPASKYAFDGKAHCLPCPSASVVASEYPKFSSRGWTMCGAAGLDSNGGTTSPPTRRQITHAPTPALPSKAPSAPSALHHAVPQAGKRRAPATTAAPPTAKALSAPAVVTTLAARHPTPPPLASFASPRASRPPHDPPVHPQHRQHDGSGGTHYALISIGAVVVLLVGLAFAHAWSKVKSTHTNKQPVSLPPTDIALVDAVTDALPAASDSGYGSTV